MRRIAFILLVFTINVGAQIIGNKGPYLNDNELACLGLEHSVYSSYFYLIGSDRAKISQLESYTKEEREEAIKYLDSIADKYEENLLKGLIKKEKCTTCLEDPDPKPIHRFMAKRIKLYLKCVKESGNNPMKVTEDKLELYIKALKALDNNKE